MNATFFTILTPSFNRAGSIARAVESVLAQGGEGCEHIVIDGGSTDGTLDVLKKYPHLRVISEPDDGMYDALNKGLRLARGRVIGLLNTDDTLAPGALASVRAAFDAAPEASAVMGGVAYERDGQVTERPAPTLDRFLTHAGRNAANFPNGWFLRREAYDRSGSFDPSYRYIADWDLLIRIALAGIRPVRVDAILYHYSMPDDSATLSRVDSRQPARAAVLLRVYAEQLRVAEAHIDRPDLPGELRRGLHAVHARTAYRQCLTALFQRDRALAAQAARRGLRRQPLWPLVFAYYLSRRLLKGIFPAWGLDD